jgi:hypothetical protein
MIVTDKQTYKPLTLDARKVLDIKDYKDFSRVLMKDGTDHLVDEREYHIRSLMLVELTNNVKGTENEKV